MYLALLSMPALQHGSGYQAITCLAAGCRCTNGSSTPLERLSTNSQPSRAAQIHETGRIAWQRQGSPNRSASRSATNRRRWGRRTGRWGRVWYTQGGGYRYRQGTPWGDHTPELGPGADTSRQL